MRCSSFENTRHAVHQSALSNGQQAMSIQHVLTCSQIEQGMEPLHADAS